MKKFHLQASENDESFIKIDHLLYEENDISCTGTLPKIKSGAPGQKNSGGRELAREYPLNLVRLKKFVQVSECTGFCVDTENAAV